MVCVRDVRAPTGGVVSWPRVRRSVLSMCTLVCRRRVSFARWFGVGTRRCAFVDDEEQPREFHRTNETEVRAGKMTVGLLGSGGVLGHSFCGIL